MAAIEVRPYDDSLSADAADVVTRYLSEGQLGEAGGSTLSAVVARVQEADALSRVLAVVLRRLKRDVRLSVVYVDGTPSAFILHDDGGAGAGGAGRLSTLRKALPRDASWKTALRNSLAKKFLLKPAVWNLALRLLKDTKSWDVAALTGEKGSGLFIALAPEAAYRDGSVEQALAQALGAAEDVHTVYVEVQGAAGAFFRGAGFVGAGEVAIPGLRLGREPVSLVSARR